ncbi:MAG TPA: hypothetical protein VH761_03595, partial [Ilumatobacteraceae bacterium]
MGVFESLLAIDLTTASRNAVAAGLAESRRLRARLDAFDVAAARRLDELARVSPSIFPERVVADAAKVSVTEAARNFERARTIDTVAEIGEVLAAGETTAGHVDVVSRA